MAPPTWKTPRAFPTFRLIRPLEWQELDGEVSNRLPPECLPSSQHTSCTPSGARPLERAVRGLRLADAGSVTLRQHFASLSVKEGGRHISGAFDVSETIDEARPRTCGLACSHQSEITPESLVLHRELINRSFDARGAQRTQAYSP